MFSTRIALRSAAAEISSWSSCVELSVGVDHHQHEIGVGHGLAGFLDPDALGFVQRLANAGGIDEMDGNAAERNRFGDEIAGGAGNGGDDGAVALDKSIEQAGFADVRAADDGQGQALVYDLAEGEALLKL